MSNAIEFLLNTDRAKASDGASNSKVRRKKNPNANKASKRRVNKKTETKNAKNKKLKKEKR